MSFLLKISEKYFVFEIFFLLKNCLAHKCIFILPAVGLLSRYHMSVYTLTRLPKAAVVHFHPDQCCRDDFVLRHPYNLKSKQEFISLVKTNIDYVNLTKNSDVFRKQNFRVFF